MKCTGVIKNISQDFQSGKINVTLEINETFELRKYYSSLKDKLLSIDICKFRKKRSKDANAYMWELLQKMAVTLNTSKDEVYLKMLERYGVFTHIVAKENATDKVIKEWRYCKVLGKVKVGNMEGVQIQCYFGSSTYNTKEMSHLLNGVVSECKELGIETLTPHELELMKIK